MQLVEDIAFVDINRSDSQSRQTAFEQLNLFCELMGLSHKLYHANPKNPKKPMDITNSDVQDLLKSLNKHDVKFMLVGGMAGVFHGHVRTTQDMDLWVRIGDENKQKLIDALLENEVSGAEYLKDTPLIFGWTSVRFGRIGFELDMGYAMKAFKDTDFDACYERALDANLDGVLFKVIQLRDLLTEKQTNPRPKDLADAEELSRILREH